MWFLVCCFVEFFRIRSRSGFQYACAQSDQSVVQIVVDVMWKLNKVFISMTFGLQRHNPVTSLAHGSNN